jgi:hypothetical protein
MLQACIVSCPTRGTHRRHRIWMSVLLSGRHARSKQRYMYAHSCTPMCVCVCKDASQQLHVYNDNEVMHACPHTYARTHTPTRPGYRRRFETVRAWGPTDAIYLQRAPWITENNALAHRTHRRLFPLQVQKHTWCLRGFRATHAGAMFRLWGLGPAA